MRQIIYLMGFCLIVIIAQGKTLRGAINEYKSIMMKALVKKMYNRMYWSTIDQIARNQHVEPFTMYCIPHNKTYLQNSNCIDGYDLWKTTYYNEDIVLYNISSQQIESDVMTRIANVFPDANINKYNKNCCNYYNISW